MWQLLIGKIYLTLASGFVLYAVTETFFLDGYFKIQDLLTQIVVIILTITFIAFPIWVWVAL